MDTIDFEEAHNIAGVSLSVAAGAAGVKWPDRVFMFVSDDAENWWEVGELMALSGPPPDDSSYAKHSFRTDELTAQGRYLALTVWAQGPYLFTDELEVFGAPTEAEAPREGVAVRDLRAATVDRAMQSAFRRDVELDVEQLQRAAGATLDAALADEDVVAGVTGTTRAIVPYTDAHARALAVRAQLWQAAGEPELRVWQGHPQDQLGPWDLAPENAGAPSVVLRMMAGEVRSSAINITNAGDEQAVLRVEFEGEANWVTPLQVAWTRTRDGGITGSALPALEESSRGPICRVPAGMTQQLWLSVDSSGLPAGEHTAALILSEANAKLAQVPISVTVSPVTMPEELSLGLGGWDYSDYASYGIRNENREAAIAFLQEYHVNMPWATAQSMRFGAHDETGAMVKPPATRVMDQWLDNWPDARGYCVFVAFAEDLADTNAARRRVREWIDFWVDHLASRGVEPDRLFLLLADEPHTFAMDRRIVDYARVIKAAQPSVNIWIDPTWRDPTQATPELFEVADAICGHRWLWQAAREQFEQVILGARDAGARLEFYSCHVPARALDPYSYHRLQAWDCFRYGMSAEHFWSFGANGGASAWTENAAKGLCATPQFLDEEGCTTSKQMEAIREGLYDHEYLVMLRDRLAEIEKQRPDHPLIKQGRTLLIEGPARVLSAPGTDSAYWAETVDRGVADTVRLQVLDLLEASQAL